MKKRKFSSDGIMHVYQRTIDGFNLFYSTKDFLVFYTIVSIMAKKSGICLLGMCLMIDHVHLLIAAEDLAMMSRFIASYTSVYVREFNTRTGRHGSLFETPYGSALKLDLKRIRSAIAYLFNNPVEKQLCKKAEDYRWNFLKYYETVPETGKRHFSRKLKRAISIVRDSYENGRYLNYALLDNLMTDLTSEEKELLTGYIITTYFPFDNRKTIGYYGSYKDMLTAINSNTGSEYDIQEKHLCKSDTQYRELLSYIKRPGHPDIYTILKMPLKEKTALMHTLKQQTSASYVQIMKFLHIPRHRKQTANSLIINTLNKQG